MAYGILYTAQFKDKLSSNIFKIDILQDDYAGSATTITYMGAIPVIKRYQSDKGEEQHIIGSTFSFSFMSLSADSNKYDALFEGDIKEFKLNFYTSPGVGQDWTPNWTGFLQPDNLNRTYLNELYEITLNATDWLASLKDVEFRNGANAYADESSVLSILKTCLSFTNIELDFYTQLNTYETTYHTSTTDILNNTFINKSRFTTSKDGKTKYTSVYNVITEILKPFNLSLKQESGQYHLINTYELDSYHFVHNWTTLTPGSRTASSNILNIDDYTFLSDHNLSKLKPKLKLDITRYAKDTGGSLIADLDDFSGTGPWTINAPDGHTQSADEIVISDDEPENNGSYISVPSSSQTGLTGRYLHVEFDTSWIDDLDPTVLKLNLIITKPVSGATSVLVVSSPETFHYESPIADMFEMGETGVYTIKIEVLDTQLNNPIGELTIQNVRITTEVIDTGQFDRNYIGYIDQDSQVTEKELFFSDADTDTDKGGLKAYSSGYVKTTAWNRYNETDGLTIQELWALNLLKNRQSYKNYISLSIIDNDFNINASSILQIDTTNYKIIALETVYNKNIQKVSIEEILTSDPSYTFTTSEFTTVSGESTSTYSPQASIGDHGDATGLADDDHTQYHTDARGDARYPLISEAEIVHEDFNVTTTEVNDQTALSVDATDIFGITSGNTDAGTRIAALLTAIITDSGFLGTIANQYGARILYGKNTGAGAGTLTNAYGLYLLGYDAGSGTITNKYGVYQSGSTFLNYFEGVIKARYRRAMDSNGMAFQISTGSTYWLMENDGDFHAEGDVVANSSTVSDKRLKENIKSLSNALNKVCKIEGVSFNYNGKNDPHVGIIAQDLKKIIPEVVIKKKLALKTNTNKKYFVVRYTELIPYIIESIKELFCKIKGLTIKVNKNDDEIKRIKYELCIIKKKLNL